MSEENKKLSEEVLKQLGHRRNAVQALASEIAGKQVILQMANREFNLYLEAQVKESGWDMSKPWTADDKTGEIKEQEVKVTPVKKEE